ncbi:hypothetical protein A5662_15565 [Mycobacteriaceae bacterium 1482268.1]|nr:hypothetical protein A5662_15565 [Mycobacteriaceae bacterium 1482268.1]
MHRAPCGQQSIAIRIVAAGGAVACLGLAAQIYAPDADALSILLPSFNGNATQINILEGNVFRPQFGLAGGGSNSSDNSTMSDFLFGLGGEDASSSDGDLFGPIVLGDATGNGNVTQINIISYNIFNPQISPFGGNSSRNLTVSNVAVGNGNGQSAAVSGSNGGTSLIGGAAGNGNSRQISLFSSNIFNPQFSLFGDNMSNNAAITNVAGVNGNGSQTTATSPGLFGTSLFGSALGNGNTTQVASGSANIFNPQFSLLGHNTSNNRGITNLSFLNGNHSETSTTSNGFLGTSLFGGTTGNGNTNQFATFVTNIFNPQWSVVGGNESHNDADTNDAALNGNDSQNQVSSPDGSTIAVGTTGNGNTNQTGYGTGNIVNDQLTLGNQAVAGALGLPGAQNQQVLLPQQGQQATNGQTAANPPRPLSTLVKRLKEAVNQTFGGKSNTTGANTDTAGQQSGGTSAPSGDGG